MGKKMNQVNQDAQRDRLRTIYNRIYKDITIDSILDKYEQYCKWCTDHKVFPKDLINWATYTQNYPQVILEKIRDFLTDFDA